MVNGTLVGDGNIKISNICTIQKSKPGSIAFFYNNKYSNHLASSEASAIIATEKDFIKSNGIIVENPQLALIKVLKHFKVNTPAQKGYYELSSRSSYTAGVRTCYPQRRWRVSCSNAQATQHLAQIFKNKAHIINCCTARLPLKWQWSRLRRQ